MFKHIVAFAAVSLQAAALFAAPPPPPVYLPEILVTGLSTPIQTSSTQPLKLDGTYFNKAQIGVNSWEHTFEIRNFGKADLQVTVPLTLSGPAAGDFEITQQPNAIIPPGQRSAFKVRFTPSFVGNAYATVNIENNDPDENPYHFEIRGDGVSSALIGPDLEADLVFYKRYKCKGIPLLSCKMGGRVMVRNLSESFDQRYATVRVYVVDGDLMHPQAFLVAEMPLEKLMRAVPGKKMKVKKVRFKNWIPPGYTHIYAEVVPEGSEDINYTNNRTEQLYGI